MIKYDHTPTLWLENLPWKTEETFTFTLQGEYYNYTNSSCVCLKAQTTCVK